jgi:hypothetical protein
MVDGLPGREVVGQQPPGTAAANDVEDGIQDLASGVHLGTSGGFRCAQVGFEAAPFGIGEVALVCFSHARYPTERVPQNPFSDSFKAKFAFWAFSAPLCQAALREGACESARRLLKTASETRLLRHRSASLRDLPSAIFLR